MSEDAFVFEGKWEREERSERCVFGDGAARFGDGGIDRARFRVVAGVGEEVDEREMAAGGDVA